MVSPPLLLIQLAAIFLASTVLSLPWRFATPTDGEKARRKPKSFEENIPKTIPIVTGQVAANVDQHEAKAAVSRKPEKLPVVKQETSQLEQVTNKLPAEESKSDDIFSRFSNWADEWEEALALNADIKIQIIEQEAYLNGLVLRGKGLVEIEREKAADPIFAKLFDENYERTRAVLDEVRGERAPFVRPTIQSQGVSLQNASPQAIKSRRALLEKHKALLETFRRKIKKDPELKAVLSKAEGFDIAKYASLQSDLVLVLILEIDKFERKKLTGSEPNAMANLALPPTKLFNDTSLRAKSVVENMTNLAERQGSPDGVSLQQEQVQPTKVQHAAAAHHDPLVSDILETFPGAKVVNETVCTDAIPKAPHTETIKPAYIERLIAGNVTTAAEIAPSLSDLISSTSFDLLPRSVARPFRTNTINKNRSLDEGQSHLGINAYTGRVLRQDIREEAEAVGIPHLVHFTRVTNIPSIMENGLCSIQTSKILGLAPDINDGHRMDFRPNGTSLSITFPNYRMFFKYRAENPDVDWTVLLIDPAVLWTKECAFCRYNAADKRISQAPLETLTTVDAFSGMFKPGEMDRGPELKPYDPTDSQAEVLVFDTIEPRFIDAAAFETKDSYAEYRSLLMGVEAFYAGKGNGLFGSRMRVRRN